MIPCKFIFTHRYWRAGQKPEDSEMMLHLRIDDEELNSRRKFACGIGPDLPEGDLMFFAAQEGAAVAYLAGHPEIEHCPGCFGRDRPQFGTPLSQLSGRPGHPGFERFSEIARSWGYD